MKHTILLLLLTILGCGGEYDVKVGGNVKVEHSFSIQDAYNYFYQQCRMMYPNATEQQLSVCANDSLDDWLNTNNISVDNSGKLWYNR